MTRPTKKKIERAVGELARELERVEKVKRLQKLMAPSPAERVLRAKYLREMGSPALARLEERA